MNKVANKARINNTRIVFTYVCIEEDKTMLDFFKLDEILTPRVIAFDFSKNRFHVDTYRYDNQSREIQLEEFVYKFSNNALKLSAGGVINDFFYNLGIELTAPVVIIILAVILLIVILICSYYAIFKNIDTNEKKEDYTKVAQKEGTVDKSQVNNNAKVTKKKAI